MIPHDPLPKVLHIIPDHVFARLYQGSYKDVIGRVRYFENGPVAYRQLRISDDRPDMLEAMLKEFTPTHILIEYSHYRRILSALRQSLPDAFIAVRAINIEPLQHFDNYGWFPPRGTHWLLYGMFRLLWADVTCRRKANAIYAITEWERDRYWQWLPGQARVEWLPYFTPDSQVSKLAGVERQDVIACIPGGVGHRRNRDLAQRFIEFAEMARSVSAKYQFVITGDLTGTDLVIPEFITQAGMVDDIAAFLRSVKAIAILSPLGYGFKTSIADALANQCYVLLHDLHYRRSPALVKDLCIPVQAINADAVSRVLAQIVSPFPSMSVNNIFQETSQQILQNDFDAAPQQSNFVGTDNGTLSKS